MEVKIVMVEYDVLVLVHLSRLRIRIVRYHGDELSWVVRVSPHIKAWVSLVGQAVFHRQGPVFREHLVEHLLSKPVVYKRAVVLRQLYDEDDRPSSQEMIVRFQAMSLVQMPND